MATIYHLALEAEWQEAQASNLPYRRSTIGRSLEEDGFIHCSFAEQVDQTAELLYAGRDDVLVLTIDTDKLDAEMRVEGGFPHVYGEMPLSAVVGSTRWRNNSTSRTR